MMRRYFTFALIFVMFSAGVLALHAQAPNKPVITAKVGGKTFKGVAGSYCWPDDSGQVACDKVDDVEPKVEIPVAAGDTIEFTADPVLDKAGAIKAALLDQPDPNGDPTEVDLTASKGVYTVNPDLKPGKQRIQAEFYSNGDQNFVFYVFLLNVGAGGVTAATPGATQDVTALPTAAVTVEVVTAPAEAATQAVTESPTTAVTAAATSQATMVATEAATVTVAPTSEAKMPTPSETWEAPSATVHATVPAPATVTVTPTIQPTSAVPTLTYTPSPTNVAATAVPTTSGLPSPDQVVPGMIFSVGGKEFTPVAIEGCEARPGGTKVCVSGPVNSNAPVAEAVVKSDALYLFKGAQPSEVKLATRDADGVKVIREETATANNVVLMTLPAAPGTYVLTIEVVYPSGRATYFFRVAVK